MKFSILVLAIAVTAIAGCAKENTDPVSKAINHIADEREKKTTEAQLKGQWISACDTKGLLWAAAGIKSERIVHDFYSNTGKTSQLFSDDSCQKQIGEATYTGTATVGAPSAVDSSNILDLNYTNVSIKITEKAVVDALNSPLTPGCGINDWAADGATLHFGLADTGHDKSTQEKRPVALDMPNGFSKK